MCVYWARGSEAKELRPKEGQDWDKEMALRPGEDWLCQKPGLRCPVPAYVKSR